MSEEIFYSIGSNERFDVKWNGDIDEAAAEECADDYHWNHDGWESKWPLEFVLYETIDGPEVARFEIDREAVPSFTATQLHPVEKEPQ